MVPDHPDAAGAAVSRCAREWLKTEWSGETFLVGKNARGWNSVLTLLFTPDNERRTLALMLLCEFNPWLTVKPGKGAKTLIKKSVAG